MDYITAVPTVDFALRGASKTAGLLAEIRSCNGRKSSMDWRSIYGCLHHSMVRFKETSSYRPVSSFGGVSMHSNRLPYFTLNSMARFCTSDGFFFFVLLCTIDLESQ
jgi:hypothetical protein